MGWKGGYMGWSWMYGTNAMITPWLHWGFIPTILWSSVWKGIALWHAARREEKWWFIALLFINTAGILEICYLVFVVKLFTSEKTKQMSVKKKRAR